MRKKTFKIEDVFLWFIVGFGVLGMSAVVISGIVSQGVCPSHQTHRAVERPIVTETIKSPTKNNTPTMQSCQCVIKEEHTVCTCPNTNLSSSETTADEEKQNNGPETTGEKVVFWGSMGALALAPLLLN